MRTRFTVAAAVLVALAAACGGSGYGDSPTSPGNTNGSGNNSGNTTTSISVRDNNFSPNATTVPVGSTITWTWGGSAAHNVTFNDGPASQSQSSGSYQRTFTAAGTYPYHCTIHGAAMSGTITVQ